jgi:hypothetical protein
MYRDDQLANRSQIDALRAQTLELERRLAETERARDRAKAELDSLREGVADDPALDLDHGYRGAQDALRILAALCTLAALAAVSAILITSFAAPELSVQGLSNLFWHLRYGDGTPGLAAAGSMVLLLLPWLALPWVAAVGLKRHRRWGWYLAVVCCVLYLPTPLVFIAVPIFAIVLSGRVRRTYFPG